ncbi:MAG TPA: hypothetical protein VGE36_06945 [Roseateles sp.]
MNAMHSSLSRWLAPLVLGLAAVSTAQAGDVGVSIGFSQPGLYGRVDIGRYPQPVLIAPQPVYVGRPVYRDPVYLWVPPAHRTNWRRYCSNYGACGHPVYFVEDRWYRHNVVVHRAPPPPPHWHDRHEHRHDHDRGRGRGHDRHHDRHGHRD